MQVIVKGERGKLFERDLLCWGLTFFEGQQCAEDVAIGQGVSSGCLRWGACAGGGMLRRVLLGREVVRMGRLKADAHGRQDVEAALL